MPTFDRRRFLIGSGVLGALGVLGGTAAVTWQDLAHLGESAPLAPGSRVLVILTMYGGNDGINTVIPYSDNAYHDARPELSYRAEDVLHLDDRLGLNPALQGMRKLWDDKKLAIVRGVGYPKPDHSHFRSMDIWQTASPDQPVPTGWIGRWLDSSGDDPVRAVHVGPVLPQLAIGAKQTASTLNPASAPIPPRLAAVARDLAAADPGDSAARASVCGGYAADTTARTAFSTVGAPRGKPAKSADPLATQLDTVARCIRADVPTRVYSVALGGFDTHAAERDTQQRLLGRVDAAISGFLGDLAGSPRGRDVVVLAYSEFGRRVAANASQGTDHGTAAPVFLAGDPVRSGFHGDEPSLTDLDHGDLKTTVDFRDLYAELLHKVVGADPAPVVGTRRDLGVIA